MSKKNPIAHFRDRDAFVAQSRRQEDNGRKRLPFSNIHGNGRRRIGRGDENGNDLIALRAALDQDRHTEAARLFSEAATQGRVPTNGEVHDWLRNSIGKRRTHLLIRAYATTPCFFCRKGLQQCDFCDGRGHHDAERICERCLALGVTRCEFCDGSGWITIDGMPFGLRLPVILERARLAVGRVKQLLQSAPPQIDRENPAQSLRQCTRLLLALNRFMGVLANQVVAMDQLDVSAMRSETWVSDHVELWMTTALSADARMHAALDCMARSAHLAVEGLYMNRRNGALFSGGLLSIERSPIQTHSPGRGSPIRSSSQSRRGANIRLLVQIRFGPDARSARHAQRASTRFATDPANPATSAS